MSSSYLMEKAIQPAPSRNIVPCKYAGGTSRNVFGFGKGSLKARPGFAAIVERDLFEIRMHCDHLIDAHCRSDRVIGTCVENGER